jgi:hypothetical protein
MLLISVRLAWPKKSFQAVLFSPRHNVDVKMWDTLADPIVDGHKRPLGQEALFQCSSQELCIGKHRRNQTGRQIRQRFDVVPRRQQTVTGEQWPVIQEGKRSFILVNHMARGLASNDLAKSAIVAAISVHGYTSGSRDMRFRIVG